MFAQIGQIKNLESENLMKIKKGSDQEPFLGE
jgi:hypothetical protein